MDYKEKVIALLNSQELSKEQKEKLENIFPELKESEDERIRKELIEHIKANKEADYVLFKKFSPNDVIAWLEKQDEKSTTIDIDKMVMEYSQTKDGDFGLPVNCMIRAYRKGINDALKLLLNLEKQGDKEKNTESQSQPKFHEGDWVLNNVCYPLQKNSVTSCLQK